jgi:hypothetical protein
MTTENRHVFYLYDLPKEIVTSVKINSILKERCQVDLQDPVQFRECRPHPLTGLPSPFQVGVIKIDPADFKKVADGMKYFEITDGADRKWNCRGLPFDKDLLGANKLNTNLKQNIFVYDLPKELTAKDLEDKFTPLAKVKSAKISCAPILITEQVGEGKKIKKYDNNQPPVSNGYGFVCFQTPEDAQAVLNS